MMSNLDYLRLIVRMRREKNYRGKKDTRCKHEKMRQVNYRKWPKSKCI